MNSPADVAVIGAGPAGAWAAYVLAARGATVLLIDPSHPREKPCGGGVTGRALALVTDAIGVELPAVAIESARFIDSHSGPAAGVQVSLPRSINSLTVSSRRVFDGLLVAAACRAGAQLLAARATSVTRGSNGWQIRTADGQTRCARWLVGADGANSLVRRRVARPFRRDQLSIATGVFAHGITSTEIVIEFTADPPGYIWSFPRPDHLAIGICAQADTGVNAESLRARTAAWIQSTGIGAGGRLESYSWPIPSLSSSDLQTLDLAGPGWLLAGDAAGLVDPITREGIFFALRSASFAAEAILANGATERAYAERVREEVIAELVRAARFKDQFFRPRFIALLVDALARSERIRGVMGDLVSGSQTYRGLKRRLAATLEIGIAIRAVRLALSRPT